MKYKNKVGKEIHFQRISLKKEESKVQEVKYNTAPPQYYPPYNPYQAPGSYYNGYYMGKPDNNDGYSIAALVCGILSIFFMIIPFVCVPLAIVSICLGIKSYSATKSGRALAGIILSGISLVIDVLIILVLVVAFNSSPTDYDYETNYNAATIFLKILDCYR